MIYFIASPIGNLGDITYRAIETLKSVDYVICEDTRRAKKLLSHYGISRKKTMSYNDYNKEKKTPGIIEDVKNKKEIAFLTDAGSPCISDPGYYLIREIIKRKLPFTSIPGPSSVINGLILSGLPPDKFVFEGFLPKRGSKRTKFFKQLKNEERTTILFESPYRIKKLLRDISGILPERTIVILREMTKFFEERIEGKAPDLLKDEIKEKGEFVIVVEGKK